MKNVPLFLLCALCGSNVIGCGRKGPPLPPLQRLPSAVTAVRARRIGQDVVVQFTIPTTNTDARGPVEIDRVDVYAHTGPLPAPADFLKFGTLIGTVPVRAPVTPVTPPVTPVTPTPVTPPVTPPVAPAVGASAAAAVAPLPGFDPGAVVSVSETITPGQMVLGKMPVTRAIATGAAGTPATTDLETPGTVNAPAPLMRYYVAVAVNRRNHRGAFSAPLAVPLIDPFAAPAGLRAEYAESDVTLAWEPTARSDDIFAPVPAYNLYEVPDEVVPAPEGPPVAGAPALNHAPLKVAVNPAPLPVAAFTDPRIEFGQRRCYIVRTVRVAGAIAVESAASAPVCLTLTDTFPPAAPMSLVSVPSEGAISLIWEPNTEKDLAGYIVLRGEPPDEKLTPLTPMPIHETTYRDATVKAGVTYVYAVQAVDTAPAANRSEISAKVTEVAR